MKLYLGGWLRAHSLLERVVVAEHQYNADCNLNPEIYLDPSPDLCIVRPISRATDPETDKFSIPNPQRKYQVNY